MYEWDFLDLLCWAYHDLRPLQGAENIVSDFWFVHALGTVVDFHDLAYAKSRDGWARDQGWKVGLGAGNPHSEHGVDGDIKNPDGYGFVLDVFGVVGALDRLKAGEAFGEILIWEVFKDVFLEFGGLVSVEWDH